ncbi:Rtt105p LALA0_S01e06524g [Lachancea lanzarotensis]|uniref:LALA0S01e06524g1_1 n=1 Tax=Lachancea lanzarotensis TaxID=1245769 RepID=A0A0C7MXQ4_9SACH|nr:uncharacterized protein LALA0_S01e06524g [Lachancea lanzarotensis]CEP60255.1 LALA0S01e06524g1_1 [Lachancea lanzarotensis]
MGNNAPIQLPSSPLAPEMSPSRSLNELSSYSSPSVVEKLQHERQRQHERFRQPFSSPLKGDGLNRQLGSRDRRRSWQAHRNRIRENRILQARGGVARMEHDMMALEHNSEQLELATQAQWYQLNPDEIDKYDTSASENDDDDDDDDDDELIALLQQRDDYETQLELEEQQLEYAMQQFCLVDEEEVWEREERNST